MELGTGLGVQNGGWPEGRRIWAVKLPMAGAVRGRRKGGRSLRTKWWIVGARRIEGTGSKSPLLCSTHAVSINFTLQWTRFICASGNTFYYPLKQFLDSERIVSRSTSIPNHKTSTYFSVSVWPSLSLKYYKSYHLFLYIISTVMLNVLRQRIIQ